METAHIGGLFHGAKPRLRMLQPLGSGASRNIQNHGQPVPGGPGFVPKQKTKGAFALPGPVDLLKRLLQSFSSPPEEEGPASGGVCPGGAIAGYGVIGGRWRDSGGATPPSRPGSGKGVSGFQGGSLPHAPGKPHLDTAHPDRSVPAAPPVGTAISTNPAN